MLTVTIKGTEYTLAATLRVAYKVQGANNHKPYSKVFEEIGESTLEKQIEVLFCAFQVANPDVSIKFQEFLDHYLDNYNLRDVLSQVKEVIQGIMGPGEEDEVAEKTSKEASDQGN